MNAPIRMMSIAGMAALFLAVIVTPQVKTANPSGSDVLTQVTGGTADLASQAAYGEAETYFHAGISGNCKQIGQKAQERKSYVSSGLPFEDTIRYLHGETAPKGHRHLEGSDEKELLPWFEISVRLNPKNVEGWTTGSYWYYRTGDIDKAIAFISEGVRHNPRDYHVYMERGALYHRLGKWEQAAKDLERAQSLCTEKSDQATFDRRAIGIYLKDSRKRM